MVLGLGVLLIEWDGMQLISESTVCVLRVMLHKRVTKSQLQAHTSEPFVYLQMATSSATPATGKLMMYSH